MSLVLIVDDDRQMVALLEQALSQYQTIWASDGTGALHQIAEENPDLVLMDLRMPDMDGALLLPKIKAVSNAGVVVLSGRHEQADVVQALKAGADDFIAKPFDLADLEARVDAVLRRCARKKDETPREQIVHVGSLTISTRSIAVRVGDQTVALTPTEYRLMFVLANHAGVVVTRQQLGDEVWGLAEDDALKHLVDVHIGRVRRKLQRVDGSPQLRVVRGQGFRLEA